MDYIKVSGIKFPTKLAITQDEQTLGLMHQKWPPPIMSFVYAEPKINKFWMKNTFVPLDIVFCLKNKIVAICSGDPHSTMLIGNDNPSDLVVEFPAGACKAYGVSVGDNIELECSPNSLMKLLMTKSGFTY